MSSVDFKFLTMPNVDFKMRVSSVELEYKQFWNVGSRPIFGPSVGCRLEKVGNVGCRKIHFYGIYNLLQVTNKQSILQCNMCAGIQKECVALSIHNCQRVMQKLGFLMTELPPPLRPVFKLELSNKDISQCMTQLHSQKQSAHWAADIPDHSI